MRTGLIAGFMVCLLLVVACGTNTAERNNAGNAAYARGDYAAAVLAYQAAQVNQPDRPESYYNAASALLQLVDYEAAVAALEQSLEEADSDFAARAYYNLGNILFEQRQFGDAVLAYQQALLRNPNDEDARYNLELTLLRYVPPTPTAIEQQTNPELGQTDPEATPTNEPGGFDGSTPTPPPAAPPDPSETPSTGNEGELGPDSQTPIPSENGDMTVERAAQILDSVEQNQEALREYLEDVAEPGDPVEQDW